MSKVSISVAIATYNEEDNLAECIKSIRSLAMEIIVVDGSSTDNTVKIAKKLGAKVLVTTNPPIFHINKQKAIDMCKGDWILQLDADERVTPELATEMMSVLKETDCNGFWLPRSNFFLGTYLRKGGQYPDYTLRLYRRGHGYLPCKSVHEQACVNGKTCYLKNDLLHIADPNFSRYLLRFDRYTTLIANELVEDRVLLNLPNSLSYLLIKPAWWFLLTFFRHKGFVDGFPGFVFSLFSAFRFPVAYIKYWERVRASKA